MANTIKTALVTGANKGIGREIAGQLAGLGYRVWLGCRDIQRAETAAREMRQTIGDVRVLRLDVADGDSVMRAAAALAGETRRLDVLVNNAGIALDAQLPPSAVDMALLKSTYEVNVFGPVRVTQAFLPLLRAAPAARIVMMSSGAGALAKLSDPSFATNLLAYSSSKTALNAVTLAFAREFRNTPIKINAANPGHVATDLNGHAGPLSVAEGAAVAIRLATLGADGPTGGFFNAAGPEPW
ncbi:MAG: SDR family oxidoreductase [Rhizobiales bacterium]|nr:SDR family oxidoreductase [Hyphomicrobiales bacterium]